MASGSGRDTDTSENSMKLAFTHPFASLCTGLRFLTIIPICWKREEDGHFFQASLIWFPLLGLCIGAGIAFSVSLLIGILPASLAAVFAMLLLAGISGCLHLDGLADSGDGLLSSRPRAQALDIMRDSRSGAMGMIAVFFVLLGKYAALSALPAKPFLLALLLMPMVGRTAILISMALLPYAREGEGLGKLFYSSASRKMAVAGSLFCVIVCFSISMRVAFFVTCTALVTVALFSFWCHRKLGGATGDTLGAVCELTELAVAVSLCLAFQPN